MIRDIKELDQDAHEQLVKLKKAMNYISSFTPKFFELKEKLDSGMYGKEWSNDMWIFSKMEGWLEGDIIRILSVVTKIHRRIVAAEEKSKLCAINAQKQEERRVAAAATQEKTRAAREAKAAEQEQKNREEQAEKVAELFDPPPIDADLAERLKEGVKREEQHDKRERDYLEAIRKSKVEVGRFYHDLQVEVQVRKNPQTGYAWKWGKWTELYIPEKATRTIQGYIKFYRDAPEYQIHAVHA